MRPGGLPGPDGLQPGAITADEVDRASRGTLGHPGKRELPAAGAVPAGVAVGAAAEPPQAAGSAPRSTMTARTTERKGCPFLLRVPRAGKERPGPGVSMATIDADG